MQQCFLRLWQRLSMCALFPHLLLPMLPYYSNSTQFTLFLCKSMYFVLHFGFTEVCLKKKKAHDSGFQYIYCIFFPTSSEQLVVDNTCYLLAW